MSHHKKTKIVCNICDKVYNGKKSFANHLCTCNDNVDDDIEDGDNVVDDFHFTTNDDESIIDEEEEDVSTEDEDYNFFEYEYENNDDLNEWLAIDDDNEPIEWNETKEIEQVDDELVNDVEINPNSLLHLYECYNKNGNLHTMMTDETKYSIELLSILQNSNVSDGLYDKILQWTSQCSNYDALIHLPKQETALKTLKKTITWWKDCIQKKRNVFCQVLNCQSEFQWTVLSTVFSVY